MTLETLIKQHIEFYLKNSMYTAIPAEVVQVDKFSENQMLTVKPSINRMYSDGLIMSPPTIHDVPVVFPSAGGGILSFPITVGDTVLLVFSMRDTSEWKFGDGKAKDPTDLRAFNITDAIAIPGLYTSNTNLSPNKTDVELKFNGLSFRLEKSGNIVLQNPSYSLTFESDGTVQHSSGARITPDGDFVTASGVSLNNHDHDVQGVQAGGNTVTSEKPN